MSVCVEGVVVRERGEDEAVRGGRIQTPTRRGFEGRGWTFRWGTHCPHHIAPSRGPMTWSKPMRAPQPDLSTPLPTEPKKLLRTCVSSWVLGVRKCKYRSWALSLPSIISFLAFVVCLCVYRDGGINALKLVMAGANTEHLRHAQYCCSQSLETN